MNALPIEGTTTLDPVSELINPWAEFDEFAAGLGERRDGASVAADAHSARLLRAAVAIKPTSLHGVLTLLRLAWRLDGPRSLEGSAGWKKDLQTPAIFGDGDRHESHRGHVAAGEPTSR